MTEKDLQTEQRIFRAATDVFVQEGLGAARMQDIADRAGINKSLLHYYFRSKERLFYAVFENLSLEMYGRFASILLADLPFDEKIRYFFREHLSFLQQNPNLPLFLLTEVNHNPELLKKILARMNFEKIKGSVAAGLDSNLSEDEIAQLMVTIISLSVFPVVAKPIIEELIKKQNISFADFIEQRKEVAPEMILGMIGMRQKQKGNKNPGI